MFQKLLLLITSFFIVLFSIHGVFANDDISLQVSKSSLEVWQDFDVAIELKGDLSQGQNMQIKIDGLENFTTLSQSQSSSFRNINGNTSSILAYTVKLQTSEVWEFIIGPVTILKNGNEFQDDASFTVSVWEVWSLTPLAPVVENQESQNIDWSNEAVSDIDDLRRTEFPKSLILLLFIIIFLIAFYILVRFILREKSKEHMVHEEINPAIPVSYYQKKITELENLQTKLTSLKQQEFYRKYNHIIRDILTHEWVSWAQKATLSEMMESNTFQSSPIFAIFRESYYKEFADQQMSIEEEQIFIDKLVLLLSQK